MHREIHIYDIIKTLLYANDSRSSRSSCEFWKNSKNDGIQNFGADFCIVYTIFGHSVSNESKFLFFKFFLSPYRKETLLETSEEKYIYVHIFAASLFNGFK